MAGFSESVFRPGEGNHAGCQRSFLKRIILYKIIVLLFELFLLYAQSLHEIFLIIFV